jgi:PPK2 family polyphosphate:nucleotide phosphotransferase
MKIKIQDLATLPPANWDEKKGRYETELLKKEIARLQNILMAGQEKSLLIILQGMDASGKDSTVKNVLSAMNPLGMRAISFKKPSEEEMSYDFLWRIHRAAPPRGMVHVFNRSHYEDVLIQRVHRWVDEATIQKRLAAINCFEQLLVDNGTVIVKCFMNISFDEQLKRLDARTKNHEKYWKHNQNDYEERKHWKAYMTAYEDAFNQCCTIPWHNIPCDNKRYKEFLVAKIVKDALANMNLSFPPLKT